MERFLGFALMSCLFFVMILGQPLTVSSQSSPAQHDTVAVLGEKIRILEERIEILESQLRERGGSETGEKEQALISSLRSQLESLTDDVESFTLALEMQQERMARVKISGEERVRFMNIDTDGAQAVGAYGEELKQETTFKHYLRLETRVAISENLMAGARLRLTNVSKSILDNGPEYLSQEWGSAFLRYVRKEFNCTIGAYDIHLTPFTLMRWDQEDNPEGGGEAGGGCLPCGGVAGAIPSESLEELTPTLSFEGARLNGMVGDFVDVAAFYARPRGAGSRQYRRHVFGARAKLLSYHRPSTSFRHLGLTVMTVRDEKTSIFLHTSASPPATENNILGLDLNVPLTEGFLLRGEWTYTEVELDSVVGGRDDFHGHALLFGFKSQYPENLKLRCSYLYLEKFFESTYRAVSYTANRQGVRGSLTLEIPQWKSAVSAFAKVLREIDSSEPEVSEDLLQTFYTASLGVSVVPAKNVLIRPSVIYRGTRRDEEGAVSEIREDAYLFINELVFTLYKDNEFIVRYQYVDSKDKVDPSLDYTAGTILTLFSLRF